MPTFLLPRYDGVFRKIQVVSENATQRASWKTTLVDAFEIRFSLLSEGKAKLDNDQIFSFWTLIHIHMVEGKIENHFCRVWALFEKRSAHHRVGK